MTLPNSMARFPRIAPEVQTAADQIRNTAAAEYERIRSDGRFNTQTITAMLAKAYSTAKTRMDDLQRKATDDASAQETKRIAAAWGIDDIAGNNQVDRSAAAMSYRDATARVEKLDSESEALWLLKQADETGDELLARAIARYAYNHGWTGTLDAYAADRPKAAEAIGALNDMWNSKPQISDLWAFLLQKPAELQSFSDYQILAAAGDQSTTG